MYQPDKFLNKIKREEAKGAIPGWAAGDGSCPAVGMGGPRRGAGASCAGLRSAQPPAGPALCLSGSPLRGTGGLGTEMSFF